MALKVNCDGFQRDRYFSRSWALITQDQGWIKPILLLTLAQLVPILGPLGVTGYTVEWARLIAWNVNAAPKQRGVNIGECISSGWRSFLVSLGWGILIGLACLVLGLVPILGGLLIFAASIFCLYLSELVRVAVLRASIYQQLGAGYKASRIWEMGSRDVEGLIHIIGIELIGNLIITILFGIFFSIVFVAMVPVVVSFFDAFEALYYSGSETEIMDLMNGLIGVFTSFTPAFVVFSLIGSFLSTLLNMVIMGAVGLWMRQFNVPAWGRSDDPLPAPMPETFVGYQAAPNPGYAYQGYTYAPQQEAPQQGYAYGTQESAGQYGYAPTYAQTQYGYADAAAAEAYYAAEQAAALEACAARQAAAAYAAEQEAAEQAVQAYAADEAAAEAYAAELAAPVAEYAEAASEDMTEISSEYADEARSLFEDAAETVEEVAPTIALEPASSLEDVIAAEAEAVPEVALAAEIPSADEVSPVDEIVPETDETIDLPKPID